jgi:hypothetical protein
MNFSRELFKEKIDKLYELLCNTYEVKDVKFDLFDNTLTLPSDKIDDLLDKITYRYGSSRLESVGSRPVKFTEIHKNGSFIELISCRFREFENCCGKVTGHQLFLRDGGDEKKKIKIVKLYFELVSLYLNNMKYTSLGFITSVENKSFHQILLEHSGFRVINQFKNKRGVNKNICSEFEVPV